VGTNVKTTVRTVYDFSVEQCGSLFTFRICASGFLYNMARAMVGTVVYAALGKLAPEEIPAILEAGDRCLAGPTVPPQGLYMTGVWYAGQAGRMMLE
jgi:tRNA pseudouridine38-40 synthase